MTLVDDARKMKAASAPKCSMRKLADSNPDVYAELIDGMGKVGNEFLTKALNVRMKGLDPEWQDWSKNIIEHHSRNTCRVCVAAGVTYGSR